MKAGKYIAESVADQMQEVFEKIIPGATQKRKAEYLLSKGTPVAQSVLSRILSKSYSFKNHENIIFQGLAKFLDKDPLELWTRLEAEFEKAGKPSGTEHKAKRLRLGIPSSATFSAPIINAIDKNPFESNLFPEWLELSHVHKTDNNKQEGDIYAPVFCTRENYRELLFESEANKTPKGNPFLDCYLSGHLPGLLMHIDPSRNDGKRFFDVILCPDELINEHAVAESSPTRLEKDNNEIIKIATITKGYSGLVCLFEKLPKGNRKLDPDHEKKGYHIEYCPDQFNEVDAENPDFFTKFLEKLDTYSKDTEFCICGFESSASLSKLQKFISDQYNERKNSGDKYASLLHKLYLIRPVTIDFTTDNTAKYKDLASRINGGEKLLLVGYSPYMHNFWQAIYPSTSVKEDKSHYIELTRFNFSQWIGKSSYSLYMARHSFNFESMKRIHHLLKLIYLNWQYIKENRELDPFYFYAETAGGKNKLEPKMLFNRACDELGFSSEKPVDKFEEMYADPQKLINNLMEFG